MGRSRDPFARLRGARRLDLRVHRLPRPQAPLRRDADPPRVRRPARDRPRGPQAGGRILPPPRVPRRKPGARDHRHGCGRDTGHVDADRRAAGAPPVDRVVPPAPSGAVRGRLRPQPPARSRRAGTGRRRPRRVELVRPRRAPLRPAGDLSGAHLRDGALAARARGAPAGARRRMPPAPRLRPGLPRLAVRRDARRPHPRLADRARGARARAAGPRLVRLLPPPRRRVRRAPGRGDAARGGPRRRRPVPGTRRRTTPPSSGAGSRRRSWRRSARGAASSASMVRPSSTPTTRTSSARSLPARRCSRGWRANGGWATTWSRSASAEERSRPPAADPPRRRAGGRRARAPAARGDRSRRRRGRDDARRRPRPTALRSRASRGASASRSSRRAASATPRSRTRSRRSTPISSSTSAPCTSRRARPSRRRESAASTSTPVPCRSTRG